MKRKIIKIDLKKCTGCGLCIPNCPEGALQIIDGKARLISDLFCDGLGACIGTCPFGAITIEEREAKPYSEKQTMENIIKQGANVIKAHLDHLKDHGETDLLKQALQVLQEKNINLSPDELSGPCAHKDKVQNSGCPGARVIDFSPPAATEPEAAGRRQSQLRQWPVQLHLVPATAPYFRHRDVLIAADCVAYAIGDFHKDFLTGKSLAIACPKLDSSLDIYAQKITTLIDQAEVNTITVMTMEVPCCYGLLQIVISGAGKAKRKVPVKSIVIGISGNILKDEWITI